MGESQLSVDKHYEFVSSQSRYHTERINQSFIRFVTTFSTIVGGSVWLSLQPRVSSSKAHKLAILSDLLVACVATVCIVMVIENLRAWRGYRMAMHRIAGTDPDGNPVVPAPRMVRASKEEAVMLLAILTASVLFAIYNPFKI